MRPTTTETIIKTKHEIKSRGITKEGKKAEKMTLKRRLKWVTVLLNQVVC